MAITDPPRVKVESGVTSLRQCSTPVRSKAMSWLPSAWTATISGRPSPSRSPTATSDQGDTRSGAPAVKSTRPSSPLTATTSPRSWLVRLSTGTTMSGTSFVSMRPSALSSVRLMTTGVECTSRPSRACRRLRASNAGASTSAGTDDADLGEPGGVLRVRRRTPGRRVADTPDAGHVRNGQRVWLAETATRFVDDAAVEQHRAVHADQGEGARTGEPDRAQEPPGGQRGIGRLDRRHQDVGREGQLDELAGGGRGGVPVGGRGVVGSLRHVARERAAGGGRTWPAAGPGWARRRRLWRAAPTRSPGTRRSRHRAWHRYRRRW